VTLFALTLKSPRSKKCGGAALTPSIDRMLVAIISARANSKFTGMQARLPVERPPRKSRHIQRYNPALGGICPTAKSRRKPSDAPQLA
jgi:hypothetical protein